MAARATVTVYNTNGEAAGSVALPAVFTAPIRRDVVHFVHSNISKNSRQAYAVSKHAGEQTSAESWGTGRAVARIPRVSGGGTNRSGQGAFGNMCRKGRMFAPTKIWRRWHRHVNVNQRRYALVSALAASAVTALVQARGHRVEGIPQVPLVVSGLETITKTSAALQALEKLKADADVKRAEETKKTRAGSGKSRNRRYVVRRGPLVITTEAEAGAQKAFRNLPGVDVATVDRLNLLQLAPGGHVGRFCIWTQAAFERLERLYGTFTAAAELKSGYKLPRPQMTNADLPRIINSAEIQNAIRPAIRNRELARQKKNPLRNGKAMLKLNPYAAIVKKAETAAAEAKAKARAAGTKTKRTGTAGDAKRRAASKAFVAAISADEFVRPADVKA